MQTDAGGCRHSLEVIEKLLQSLPATSLSSSTSSSSAGFALQAGAPRTTHLQQLHKVVHDVDLVQPRAVRVLHLALLVLHILQLFGGGGGRAGRKGGGMNATMPWNSSRNFCSAGHCSRGESAPSEKRRTCFSAASSWCVYFSFSRSAVGPLLTCVVRGKERRSACTCVCVCVGVSVCARMYVCM